MAKILLIIPMFLFPVFAICQQWDTSLLILYSRPYYYNVVKAGDGEIYAGTSDGVFRFDETTPIKSDNRKGYLKVDNRGKLIIDPDGIKFHHQTGFNHLLPYPTEKRDEYHVDKGKYLYITSGGRMHVFDIRPYSFRFRNHSVRTISENFTGTYSGIYYKNKLLPNPISSFTDGYIREMNGKVFMCAYGLDIYAIKDIDDGPPYKRVPMTASFDYEKCSDIQFLKKTQEYILAAENRVVIVDSGLKTITTIFAGEPNTTATLMNEYKNVSFFFSAGNQLYIYNLSEKKINKSLSIDEPIMDGRVQDHNTFILSANHLYRQKGEEQPERLLRLNKAHTLQPITETEFIISTDEGLFLYKADENKLFTLIPGVEFNRRGLFLKDNKIYAGSVSGLYILEISQINQIIANANKTLNTGNGNGLNPWISAVFIAGVLLLLAILMIYRRRIKRMQSALDSVSIKGEKQTLSRAEIEFFIQNNLSVASLKAINSHFSTNTSMVYTILEPDKPGDLIQKLRYEKVKELRKEGKTAREIATFTGLSDSYIRKIWNALQ
jgi:outer membrane protein assembly factor BamB